VVLAASLENIDAAAMRKLIDQLEPVRQFGGRAGADAGTVRVAVGVSKDLIARIQAGNLVNFVAQQVGGKGGGRPDFAQAGGSQPENMENALASVSQWVKDNTG
jgi:alanyl-tRNA synthetase